MNDEMKKLLSRFLFVSVLICCLGLLATGSITASQKSAKNTFDRAYAVMSVKNSRDSLSISMGEESYTLNLNMADKIKSYRDYIMLTPLASVYYFGHTVHNIVTQTDSGASPHNEPVKSAE